MKCSVPDSSAPRAITRLVYCVYVKAYIRSLGHRFLFNRCNDCDKVAALHLVIFSGVFYLIHTTRDRNVAGSADGASQCEPSVWRHDVLLNHQRCPTLSCEYIPMPQVPLYPIGITLDTKSYAQLLRSLISVRRRQQLRHSHNGHRRNNAVSQWKS